MAAFFRTHRLLRAKRAAFWDEVFQSIFPTRHLAGDVDFLCDLERINPIG